MKKKKIDYTSWSKDELIKEIKRIRETTYGLVWHRDVPQEKIDILINPDARTPEEMFTNEVAGKPFPVLKEVKNKNIVSDKSAPTNILIEGDNYHSLAVLNFTHQEAIDVIYIDPPYNTGNNDFIYTDNFNSGYVDKEDPFRHSKWLTFMEKRLRLSYTLLKKDGVIFINIDDNEQAPLKMLCDEIFGENNFIANVVWQHSVQGKNDAKKFSLHHSYVLVYSRSDKFKLRRLKREEKHNVNYSNPDEDTKGPWRSGDVRSPNFRANLKFDIKTPSGKIIKPPAKGWRWSRETLKEKIDSKEIIFSIKEDKIIRKIYLKDQKDRVPETIWFANDVGTTREASQELKELFNNDVVFDTPKPTRLIKHILKLGADSNAIILDFFAGSGTTGQAVLEQNKLDGGTRAFILCTNNGDEKFEHKIATDVCHHRIKKVAKGYENLKGEKIKGIGGNLKYFTAYDFVESEPTDKNKRKLVKKSTEMLCIKEGVFDLVKETEEYKIFKNNENKYLGIIFYDEAIDEYKKAIKKIDQKINTYVFSLGDDPHKAQFADVADRVVLQAIPEVILKVYQEIFK